MHILTRNMSTTPNVEKIVGKIVGDSTAESNMCDYIDDTQVSDVTEALAKEILSADNECEAINGAMLFKNRRAPGKDKDAPVDKGALACALELADLLNHQFIVKYAASVKDHWYGSYADEETAVRCALSHADSKYFEIIRKDLARYAYVDLEYLIKTLIGIGGKSAGRVSKNTVLQKVIKWVCDYAEELCGRPVSRDVTIAMSLGQANCKTWKNLPKISYHIKFNFAFPDAQTSREFMQSLVNRIMQSEEPLLRYTKKDKKGNEVVKCVIDDAPYQSNQSWRCLNSIKPEDSDPLRRLIPHPSSSKEIKDHLVGIYDESTLKRTDILNLDLASPCRRPVKKQLSDTSDISTASTSTAAINAEDSSPEFLVPDSLLRETIQHLSQDRADNYMPWIRVIWGVFNVSYEMNKLELGYELVHAFSQKSSKYNKREVDVLWNSSKYMSRGLKWPSLRSCLWQDDRPTWKKLRSDDATMDLMARDDKEMYRHLYMPHTETYKEVIKRLESYRSKRMKPVDFAGLDGFVCHSAMGTGKGLGIEELVKSGQYESIVIVVNRITLTTSTIKRLNKVIERHFGDTSRTFADYRRPYEANDGETENDENPPNCEDSDDPQRRRQKQPTKIELEKVPFVIIQMESIHKLCGTPALLILDECESDLNQISSDTMHRLKGCSDTLATLMKNSRHLLFLDAFISDRTLSFIESTLRGTGKIIGYQENYWKPDDRHAYEIRSKNKDSASIKSLTCRAILAKIGAGKRVVIFSSNNKYAVEVLAAIKAEHPDKVVYFYNGETDDNLKSEHLQDVDALWSQADVVIYTPTILTGVSFNLDRFDCIFIYAITDSCTIRDMWQAAGRVRNFNDKELYYSLDTFGDRKWHLPLTYKGVKASVVKSGELNRKYSDEKEMYPADEVSGEDELYDVVHTMTKEELQTEEGKNRLMEAALRAQLEIKYKKTPEWLLDVHVRNKWEENLTRHPGAFRTVYHDFMQLAGWQQSGKLTEANIITWENAVRRLRGEAPVPIRRPSSEDQVDRDYKKITDIDSTTAQYFTTRRDRGVASNEEKLQLQKYWFNNIIVRNKQADHDARARVFNLISQRAKMRLLLNLWSEANEDPTIAQEKLAHLNPFPEVQGPQLTAVIIVRKICRLLGLKASHDTESIVPEEVLQEKLGELEESVRDYQQGVDVAPSKSKADTGTNKKTPAQVLKLNIDTVLKSFAGTKLKGTCSRSRSNGRVRQYKYMVDELDDDIKDMVMCVVNIEDDSLEILDDSDEA